MYFKKKNYNIECVWKQSSLVVSNAQQNIIQSTVAYIENIEARLKC